VDYLNALIEKKICLIDYEVIKDAEGKMVVGSSKLAGIVGCFDMLRLLGEFMLLRKSQNTPFLFTGGSAYMHENYESCQAALAKVAKMDLPPMLFGVVGSGAVAEGAIEVLKQLGIEYADPEDIRRGKRDKGCWT